MQRYFSYTYICDSTDVQADWRKSWTYGRAPNAIDVSYVSLTCRPKPIRDRPFYTVIPRATQQKKNSLAKEVDKTCPTFALLCLSTYRNIIFTYFYMTGSVTSCNVKFDVPGIKYQQEPPPPTPRTQLTKYEVSHPMAASENYSSSGMLKIVITVQRVCVIRYNCACKFTHCI